VDAARRIIYPTGGGTGMVGMWKAFAEMSALGWIDPVKRPYMVTVQAAGCAPIIKAFTAGAESRRCGRTRRGRRRPARAESHRRLLVLRAVRESNGAAVAVSDADMVTAMKELGRLEGISAAPEGGAALQALRVLIAERRVKPDDTVVVFNTGGALKYLDVLG
jgi:threonine synthase